MEIVNDIKHIYAKCYVLARQFFGFVVILDESQSSDRENTITEKRKFSEWQLLSILLFLNALFQKNREIISFKLKTLILKIVVKA